MKLKTTSNVGAAVMAAFALTSIAQAVQITGSISMSAHESVALVNTTANTVTFTSSTLPNPNINNAQVDSVTPGSVMAGLIAVDDLVDYKNFTYDALAVSGGNPIWSFSAGVLSFDIYSVTSISESTMGQFSSVRLFGTGVINSTTAGYETTTGFWSFSADSTNGGSTFGWSSTATGVPDGGTTLALFGMSLLGLHGARRKFAKR